MCQPVPDASELFRDAKQSGDLSPTSASLLSGLSHRINKTMATLPASLAVTEQTQLCMLLDNSPSMEYKDNYVAVVEGHNLVVNALLTAGAVNSIESLTVLLHEDSRYIRNVTGSDDHFRWTALRNAPRLDARGFVRSCNTPLFDRCLESLGSIIARTKYWEDNFGVQCRSVTLLMSDGADNASKASAKDVHAVVKDMLAMEKHKIIFMGVQCEGVDFVDIGNDMGIPDDCITVVESDPRAIRSKFQLFSQSAVSVAKNCAVGI